MSKFERKDKLRLANSLLGLQEWGLLKQEFEDRLKFVKLEIDAKLADEKIQGVFLNEGIRLGIKWCLETPERLQKENQKFFDRLYDKAVGKVNNK